MKDLKNYEVVSLENLDEIFIADHIKSNIRSTWNDDKQFLDDIKRLKLSDNIQEWTEDDIYKVHDICMNIDYAHKCDQMPY